MENEFDDGPVPVEGDITPITRQRIPQVNSARWLDMNVGELQDQKSILDARYVMAAQIGNYALMQQIQMGITYISSIINSKADKDVSLI